VIDGPYSWAQDVFESENSTAAADPFSWSAGSKLVNEVGGERWLAKRIQTERKARGMSQAGLSKAMSDHGHPLHQSAISKIEAPPENEGPRTITIGEAIGFSKVFGIPLGELLLPPDATANVEAWQKYTQAADLRYEIDRLTRRYDDLIAYLRQPEVRALPGFTEQLIAHREGLQGVDPGLARLPDSEAKSRLVASAQFPEAVAVIDEILDGTRADKDGDTET
jgi:transcriptional regulator with XRE-family HTH domain